MKTRRKKKSKREIFLLFQNESFGKERERRLQENAKEDSVFFFSPFCTLLFLFFSFVSAWWTFFFVFWTIFNVFFFPCPFFLLFLSFSCYFFFQEQRRKEDEQRRREENEARSKEETKLQETRTKVTRKRNELGRGNIAQRERENWKWKQWEKGRNSFSLKCVTFRGFSLPTLKLFPSVFLDVFEMFFSFLILNFFFPFQIGEEREKKFLL